jgi:hypothetical protein
LNLKNYSDRIITAGVSQGTIEQILGGDHIRIDIQFNLYTTYYFYKSYISYKLSTGDRPLGTFENSKHNKAAEQANVTHKSNTTVTMTTEYETVKYLQSNLQ